MIKNCFDLIKLQAISSIQSQKYMIGMLFEINI